jgi:hypothetical protein
MESAADQAIRAAAFAFLDGLRGRLGDALPWAALLQGFTFHGRRVPLISQQGIFKPAVFDLPLNIRTTAPEEGKATEPAFPIKGTRGEGYRSSFCHS